jgi:hypothetical protein
MISRIDWKAIWAGTFIFYAIWAVFGALGVAIFASNANPNAGAPVLGQSVGMAIWAVILTIIAMYVAGRQTGRLAAVSTRNDGLMHALAMFGLAVVGLIVLVSLGGAAMVEGNASAATATTHSPYALTVVADLGWGGFCALFLGWLAAMFGGAQGVDRKIERREERLHTEPREIRPAA